MAVSSQAGAGKLQDQLRTCVCVCVRARTCKESKEKLTNDGTMSKGHRIQPEGDPIDQI